MCTLQPSDWDAAAAIVESIDDHLGTYIAATTMLTIASSEGLIEYIRQKDLYQVVLGCTDQSQAGPYEILPPVTRHYRSSRFNVRFLHSFLTLAVQEVDDLYKPLRDSWECQAVKLLHQLRNAVAHDGRWQRDNMTPASAGRYSITRADIGRPALYVEWNPDSTDGMWPGNIYLLLEELRDHLLAEMNQIRSGSQP